MKNYGYLIIMQNYVIHEQVYRCEEFLGNM